MRPFVSRVPGTACKAVPAPSRLRIVGCLAVFLALSPAWRRPVTAGEATAGRQTYLLLRVLGYDDSVLRRSTSELEIAVLFKQGDVRSQATAAEVAAALSDSEGTAIEGRALRVRLVSIDPGQSVAQSLRRDSTSVYYVCEGLESEVGAITAVSRQRKVLTIAGNEGMVRAGISLGILPTKGGQSPILVNLRASREEGTRFRGDLLRMARVLRHGI